MNPKVDHYLSAGCGRCKYYDTPRCKVHRWHKELHALRSILIDSGLTEELKWGMPCYTLNGRNVLIMSAFKEYPALSFFKGALLKDELGLLTKPGDNSQASRQFRISDAMQVIEQESIIKSYIFEAIEIEKSGMKIDFKAKSELEYPEELIARFNESPKIKTSFEALTPGRQRAYVLYFSAPKQSKTRTSRIESYVSKILMGKGLTDN